MFAAAPSPKRNNHLAQSARYQHRLTETEAHLEPLVETCVLSRWGEVGDGVGVGTPLCNGGLRGIVGGVVVDVGDGADEAIWVAQIGHTHLLSWHELQRPMGAKVQHCISLHDTA